MLTGKHLTSRRMFLFKRTLSEFLYFLRIYYNEDSLSIEGASPNLYELKIKSKIMCHSDQCLFFYSQNFVLEIY